jgi:small subunit ribosomal protein S4
MVRYTGAKIKITRRLGDLPGLSRPRPRKVGGSRSNDRKKNITQYGLRLIEKQKLRFNYGISEAQLVSYVRKVKKSKDKDSVYLSKLLELRLDTIVFRVGLAPTIVASRQLVTHGHISVNKARVSIPSYQCSPNDIISVTKTSSFTKSTSKTEATSALPAHLTFNKETLTGKVETLPRREIAGLKINELLVVEYYSRKI